MKKHSVSIAIFVISLVLILTGFIVLDIYVKRASEPVTFVSSVSSEEEALLAETAITLDVSKSWAETPTTTGAQYDGIFHNNSNLTLTDWTITIKVDSGSVIDSFWSGDFTITDDGIITIVALDYNSTIEPNSELTFGFVLHSVDICDVTDASVVATPIYTKTDFPVYWVLILLLTVWGIALLVQIIVTLKLKQFDERQKHDEVIIIQSMNTFVNFIDAKDPYTKGHSTRVAAYSREIARHLGLSAREQKNIYYIALMHDVGKISIPDMVLQKPGKLTPEERNVIESHTNVGGSMLQDFTAIPDIEKGALYHHERFDGTGYPTGLKGKDIPLYARIICVADSYDAMSSKRCYRDSLSYEKIVSELTANSGKQFDPEIVRILLTILEDAKQHGTLYRYNLRGE